MLEDQYRESSKIENEYKKLLTAWKRELSNSPPTDIKKSKISKAEHVQFTLMHLFNGYLDQIWIDSQNMLQCAQAWTNQQNTALYPADTIYTMNILGLHLMKQSLRTRQEFFSIVDELNGISSLKSEEDDNDDDICSSSDSTISQDFFTRQKDHQKDHIFIDIDQQQQQLESHNTTIYYSSSQQVLDGYFKHPPTKDSNIHEDFSSSASSLSLETNRPIRLVSSPSTPTIGKNWSEIASCSQNFTPACNYSIYFPRDRDDEETTTHKLSCHFCQETVPLKKSFSADNLYSLQQHLINTTDDEVSDDDNVEDNGSSFEIASFYYNSESDNEEDAVERELLLQKTVHVEEYQLLLGENPTQGSLKIELDEQHAGIYDNSSISSSIIHYDSASKEIKKNKIINKKKKYDHQLVHERGDSSSTCLPQSTYSSEENNKSSSSDIKTRSSSPKLSSIQAAADTNSSSCNANDDSILLVKDNNTKLSSILLRKSKVAVSFIRKTGNNKKREERKNSQPGCNSPSSVVDSFSSKKMSLCHLFSTRKN